MADVRKVLIEIDADTGDVVGGIGQVNRQLKQLGTNAKLTNKEISKAAGAMQKDLAGSAGIAGAAATELGRTISDLPFGLTAVTNNISQLGNMFALLVTSAGGVNKALGALIGTLLGPVGILVGFQAVVAAIEVFGQKSKKAKEETQDFSNELILQGNVLKALRDDFLDGDKSIENRIKLLETLAITDKNLQEILKDETLTQDERIKKGEEYVDTIKLIEEEEQKLIEAKKQIEEDGRTLDELRAERQNKEAERIALKAILEQNAFNQVGLGARVEIGIRDQQINSLDALINKYDFITKQTLAIDNLRKGIQVEEKKTKKAVEETTDAIEEQVELLGQRRFAVFGEDLLDGPELTEAQQIAEEALGKVGAAAIKGFQDRVRSEGERNPFVDLLGISEETFDDAISKIQQSFDAAYTLIDSQFERELALEQRKTIALNDQLKARLANEQLTADARDRINQEIARNEAKLLEKENDIEKKRFQLNKAQAIANAGINTAVGVTKALASTNIPLATFIGVLGAAQIAAIMAQTFVPKGMPTPNLTGPGAGAGATGGEPQFNVVGAAGQNQLAAAIASTQGQPVKAYVVAGDVTTAQQLDRNIIQGASIG